MKFGNDPNAVLICERGKDGGPESKVFGFWLIRIKALFTIALLRFEHGSRDAYHSHAFNCVSWVLRGQLFERFYDGSWRRHYAGFRPIVTRRDDCHKVTSIGRTWVLTFRGPWACDWVERVPRADGSYKRLVLTHGRKVVS